MGSHYQHLGAEERGTIIALRSQEIGVREIARVLPRAPSKGAANRSAVGVLVDHRTLFLMIVRMERATTQAALAGFSQAFEPLPAELRKTLTYDQGKEPAEIFFEYCFQARDEESVAIDA